MIDTRFWAASKAQLQLLADANIHQHELISVDFSARTGAGCQLTSDGFIRIARQFGVKQIHLSQFILDQPYFRHEGIRFVCVCSESALQRFREDFEIICVDPQLKEAGF